jgi:diguanylate cyclase (GGDEF)-like protein
VDWIFRIGLAALLASIGWLASVAAYAQSGSASLKPVTLQLKWKHQFQFAGFYAAKEKNYYRSAGLDVTFAEAGPGIDPIEEVLSARAQFGVATSDLIVQRGKGHPVVVLASIFQHSPLIFVARRDLAATIHGLAGKRVMVNPYESAELFAYLLKEGIDPKSLILVPQSLQTAELVNGRVAAMAVYLTNELYDLKRSGIDIAQFSPQSSGIDFYGDVLFTSEDQIRRNPEMVKAFREASLRGWKYAMANQRELIDLILAEYPTAKKLPQLEFEAKQMEHLIQPAVVELGYTNPGRWQNIADTYAELGMVPQGFKVDRFVYDPNPVQDLRWLYLSLAGSLLAALLAGAVTLHVYRLYRKLRHEVAQRQSAQANLRLAHETLKSHLLKIQDLQRQLQEQAIRDHLTGLYNRRYMEDAVDRELARAEREGYQVSLVVMDVDHFKRINDTYSHPAGDAMLAALGKMLRQRSRSGDIACRYGGEEFLLVMPNVPIDQAVQRAEAWREEFGAMTVRFGEHIMQTTLSLGVAAYPMHGATPHQLILAADHALLRAKSSGRDRVIVAHGGGAGAIATQSATRNPVGQLGGSVS